MISRYGIPIRNIYCMLCYYCELDPSDFSDSLGDEDFTDTYNLMARLLDNSLRPILRRGMYREYVPVHEVLSIPHGKVDFEGTFREYSGNSRLVHCEHDEFSADNNFNRIIRRTLEYLCGYDGLESKEADLLEEDLSRMGGVSSVRLSGRMFDAVRVNRNNRDYVLVLNICRLVFEMRVINETGEGRYPEFSVEDVLARIYERFIFNYCSMNFTDCLVKRDRIDWDLVEGCDRTDLPYMNTDVSIYDSSGKWKLIVDAKFYGNMMSERFEGFPTLISGNLYQIYSYINNDKFDGNICGMLIYPQVSSKSYFRTFEFKNGRNISVMSLNLDAEWSFIENELSAVLGLLTV